MRNLTKAAAKILSEADSHLTAYSAASGKAKSHAAEGDHELADAYSKVAELHSTRMTSPSSHPATDLWYLHVDPSSLDKGSTQFNTTKAEAALHQHMKNLNIPEKEITSIGYTDIGMMYPNKEEAIKHAKLLDTVLPKSNDNERVHNAMVEGPLEGDDYHPKENFIRPYGSAL